MNCLASIKRFEPPPSMAWAAKVNGAPLKPISGMSDGKPAPPSVPFQGQRTLPQKGQPAAFWPPFADPAVGWQFSDHRLDTKHQNQRILILAANRQIISPHQAPDALRIQGHLRTEFCRLQKLRKSGPAL